MPSICCSAPAATLGNPLLRTLIEKISTQTIPSDEVKRELSFIEGVLFTSQERAAFFGISALS